MKTVASEVLPNATLTLPLTFLNAYPLLGVNRMEWAVSTYRFTSNGNPAADHEDRGLLKNLMWKARERYKSACRGYGFVVDLDRQRVAVPQSWRLPYNLAIDGYDMQLSKQYVAHASDPRDYQLVEGIFREAFKKHFKSESSAELGDLWQDYGSFCQMPKSGRDFLFCRKYTVSLERVGQTLVVQCQLGTATLDGRTVADYYQSGSVGTLAELIAKKRLNRQTRQNRPIDIRVWCDQAYELKSGASVLTLADADIVERHARSTAVAQQAIQALSCQAYQKPAKDIPLTHLRLILDSQITVADHHETIISPDERHRSMAAVRAFLDGADIYGQRLALDDTPFDANKLTTYVVRPPAIRIRGPHGSEEILLPPSDINSETLRRRALERAKQIREHGFLESRPINPALAWPSSFGRKRAARMRNDINHALRAQGVIYQFDDFGYQTVTDLRKQAESRQYDAVLVVLPEDSYAPQDLNDTHEQVKRALEMPTQCIHHDNTLPECWVDRHPRELIRNQGQLARRVRNAYTLCVENLFVKHGWIPFVPKDAFNYNVHVGLDVGGVHNTKAMACIGYGFADPLSGLLFRPDEIPVDVQKAEPIPTRSLYAGLLRLFEFVHDELSGLGVPVDFERALFFRDGAFLGDKDEWNELSALTDLHEEFKKRGWVSPNSIWTGVEVSKLAEGWRVFRNAGKSVENPVVGRVLNLDDRNRALVATTGAPYLRQGTALPLMLKTLDIAGSSSLKEVVRDFVWEADFGLTKTDMGSRFPWVLKVADSGALQSARSYHVTGITV